MLSGCLTKFPVNLQSFRFIVFKNTIHDDASCPVAVLCEMSNLRTVGRDSWIFAQRREAIKKSRTPGNFPHTCVKGWLFFQVKK